jgi:hypothetical protein
MDEFDITGEFTDGPGITLSRGQLEAWAGRRLSEEEIERLGDAIPHSSIPQAIGQIVSAFCDHEETRTEEEAGTGRIFRVCEDCGASSPA